MGFLLTCPHCGPRDYTEFSFEGELRPDPYETPLTGMTLWARENVAGTQDERWFHDLGCRRWFIVNRDTRTNEIDADV